MTEEYEIVDLEDNDALDPEEDLDTVTTIFLRAMKRDLQQATRALSDREARYLVDSYYQMQDNRKRSTLQEKQLQKGGEPSAVMPWLIHIDKNLEGAIRAALGQYAERVEVGRWSLSIRGIGPVIAAGLLAHLYAETANTPTVGTWWRFAGLDPTVTWDANEKRPWNARLKTLTWKIGESFVKVSNHDEDVYGKVYRARKELETVRNLGFAFKDQAERILATKKFKKDTEAYKWYTQGLLPPAHVHARAKRYAVKLFLSHWHHVAWESTQGTPPPKPYILNQEGHAHYFGPPNWPMA